LKYDDAFSPPGANPGGEFQQMITEFCRLGPSRTRRQISSAVTGHRFDRLADLSARQAAFQRAVGKPNAHFRETAASRLVKAGTSLRTPKRPPLPDRRVSFVSGFPE
jgi:hypothetical protein